MNKSIKKGVAIGLSLTTALWLSGATLFVPLASAQTVEELNAQIQQLLATINSLQSQISTLQGGSAASAVQKCSFTRDLTMGAKGDDVKCLQQSLNATAYKVADSGPGSPGSETTYFGGLTQSAVAKWQAANGVTPSVGYFGPKSRAKYDSVVVGGVTPPGPTPPPGVVVPGEGITITLASDNPGAQAVPQAASGVIVLKFNVAGTGTLSGLTFKREGIGATGDFASAGIYLYEGDRRVVSGKSLNSTTHEVVFTNLGIELKNEAKTLILRADVASGATASNRSKFTLVSADGTPKPTGTISSNEITIVGQRVGGLDPTSGAAPSNPNIGQKEAILQEFRLTASSTEDVLLQRIALVETGTISNENLSNFVLKVVGTGEVLAKTTSIGLKDLISFVLDKPYKVEKGQQKTFQIVGDIAGNARRSDTIILRFDEATDIGAIGAIYGYPVLPTITQLDADSEADTLTVQGGKITLTFNGPNAAELPIRAPDVTVFDFTIASENNVEIRNLRFNVSTTAMDTSDGYNDMKVWDLGTNQAVTSAVDITATSTNQVYTDIISFKAGESKRYKVTIDVDADNDTGDTIIVNLGAFGSSDIKNLDNNQYVNTADIVPNSSPNALSGNTMTVRVASLDVQANNSVVSDTYVRGTQDVNLVGVSLRSIADAITVKTLKFTASATTGALGSGELTGFELYEGSTLISKTYTFSGSVAPYTISFDNLTYKINKNETKNLTLKSDISSDAGNTDVYYAFITAVNDSNITAIDSDGNTLANAALTGTAANSGNATQVTIADVGNTTVSLSPNDSESKPGIVLAGGEATLAKFQFITTNEDLVIDRMELALAATTTSGTTSTTAVDTIPTLKLYDGTTLLGTYTVNGSGASAGIALVSGLNWTVQKGVVKTLTVKGVISSMSACGEGPRANDRCTGADTGEVAVIQFLRSGFKAQGKTAEDNNPAAAAVVANEKVVFKSMPKLEATTHTYRMTQGTAIPAFRFRVSADAKGQINWKKVQFKVSMQDATLSAASTANVEIRNLADPGTALTLSTVYSGTGQASNTTVTVNPAIANQTTGYVSAELTTEESIGAGSSKEYELRLSFADLNTTNKVPKATINLNRQEGTIGIFGNATSYATVATETASTTVDTDMNPSFIWTDFSATNHATSTSDWANGRYLDTFDAPVTLSY